MPLTVYANCKNFTLINMGSSMARSSLNLLVHAFVLLVLVQGARSSEKCGQGATGLKVEQASNGEMAGVDPLFEVIVRNLCACAVRGVFLRSEGFTSSIPVDAKLFRREGNDYLVADGGRIESGGEVRFRYAWARAFNITPAAVQDDCSNLGPSPLPTEAKQEKK